MYIVYTLISLKDLMRYIGVTSDLKRRLQEHNTGKVKSTKNRKTMILIYAEEFGTKKKQLRKNNILRVIRVENF